MISPESLVHQIDHVYHRGVTSNQQEESELDDVQPIKVTGIQLFSLASHATISIEKYLFSNQRADQIILGVGNALVHQVPQVIEQFSAMHLALAEQSFQ